MENWPEVIYWHGMLRALKNADPLSTRRQNVTMGTRFHDLDAIYAYHTISFRALVGMKAAP